MLKKIRENFGKYNALLITKPVNVFYLTGFTGSRAFILITKSKAYFLTDFRYIEYAKQSVPKDFQVQLINKEWKKDWPKMLRKLKINSLGFEEGFFTVAQLDSFKKISKGVKFIKSKGILENARQLKNDNEFKIIKKSQKINEKILEDTLKKLKPGITEKDIAWFILEQIHKHGANGPSFHPIVAFGNHSSVPHHQNTDRKLKKGHVVLIDMGVKYKHQCSDMTRTFFTAPPTKLQQTVYNTVLKAQENAIKSIKPGVQISKVNKEANSVIEQAGYLQNFQHGLGHGIGLNIHELPSLKAEKAGKLETGMITTVEPGIYLENNFGIRIEDMVIITRDSFENITKFPKNLKDMIIKI